MITHSRIVRVALGVLAVFVALPAMAVTLYQCTTGSGGGDQPTSDGFYVTNYPGVDLQQVTLQYSARTAGVYTFTLTAHAGAYNGPVLGTSTASVTLTNIDTQFFPIVYTFPSSAVTPGSTVAFTTSLVSGAGGLVFAETTTGGSCPGVVETVDTTPPLSSPNLNSGLPRGFVVTILGNLAGPSAVPGAAIPMLSSGGIVLLMALLLAAAVFVRRSRRP